MSENKLAFKSRRMFVKGVAATTFLSTLPLSAFYTWADSNKAELSGRNIHLNIGEKEVNITGENATATLVNGLLPGPVLKLKEGDEVTIKVTNNLSEMTTIHWHGIILEPEMDGVPGISFPGIEPGETFTYKFKLKQHGTYWYHAHTLAEQTGVYGALVIEPKDSLENEQVDKAIKAVNYLVKLAEKQQNKSLSFYQHYQTELLNIKE